MSNKNLISVFNIIGPLCVSAEDGQVLHDQLVVFLKANKAVTISFHGVKTIISAFLNSSIGQLYGEYTEADIRQLLSVDGLAPEDLALLKRVVDNSKLYFQNKKEFDAAWKSEVSDEE